MNRRRLLLLTLASVLVAPLTTHAQQAAKKWRIGILSPRSRPASWDDDLYGVFLKALRERGYIEGRNIELEWRFANNDYGTLARLADELVKAKVDVLVTNGTPAVRALHNATRSIPIVALSFSRVIQHGFVSSLAKPGGNVTGLTPLTGVAAKHLELATELVPQAVRVGYLINPDNAALLTSASGLSEQARRRGIELVIFRARAAADLANVFSEVSKQRVSTLVVGNDSVLTVNARRLAELAVQHRVATVFSPASTVEAGGLISYGADPAENYRRGAAYVDKILKGTRAGDLPIEEPTKIVMVVNRKTATALGIAIPQSILLRADRVIE